MSKSKYPNKISISDFEKLFLKVTETNLELYRTIGRTFWIIYPKDNKNVTVWAPVTLRPVLKGRTWYRVTNDPLSPDHEVWVSNEESAEEWKEAFKPLIESHLKKGNLYVRIKQQLTKYETFSKK